MAWNLCVRVSALLSLSALSACSVLSPVAQTADRAMVNLDVGRQARIEQAWTQANMACAVEAPLELARAHPTCRSLVVRGRELDCLAKRVREGGVLNHYTARDGLLNWEICVNEIARLLADGYYLGAREIERRLQLCEANLDEAANDAQPKGFTRLLGMAGEPGVVRPAPSEFGVAGRQAPAGLLKCEVLLPPSPPAVVMPVVAEPSPQAQSDKPAEVKLPEPPKPETKKHAKAKTKSFSKKAAPKGKIQKKPAVANESDVPPREGDAEGRKTKGKQT